MKKNTWSLKELYPSLKSSIFKTDLSCVKEELKIFSLWCNENLIHTNNPRNKLEHYIQHTNSISTTLEKLGEYCQLFLSTDITDTLALNSLEAIEKLHCELAPINAIFTKWLKSIDSIDSIISSSALLTEHEFFLIEAKEKSRYILNDNEEKIISKMRATGSMAWSKLWELQSSTLVIPIGIKKYPLPDIRNMAHSSDKKLRKKAYIAELSALETISETSAAALNGIKGEVITVCKMRGYTSPLEMTLFDSKMDKDILFSMIEAMKEMIPVFRKYFAKKATLLGHKNGLPFYDIFAPVGDLSMSFTYDEAKNIIIKNFNIFSKDLGDYAKMAFDKNWIDVYPKSGKRGGAFCTNLHCIKESRILTNFGGTFNDVITLAHELGHGYHGHCLNNCSHINSQYPMPIAETASTFCETIVKQALLKTAPDNEKLFILENDISDYAQIIVDILSRFLFEDEVFKRRKNGSLSVEDLSSIMTWAQKETYGDSLDKNHLHKYMWIVKPHYYDADFNYYNFPYAFGLLFSKGLYSLYLNNPDNFHQDYVKILSATGCKNHKDIALMADIDITDRSFWQNSLNIIKEEIDRYIEMA